ncbi:uncharacterized protein LOC141856202 [Brevipalpus obovatus]|uniref:uncharacterized protein LOC141856202 n=1 Tax=Brevipalpus obovatus TaxID=246614 RepID=UPI003D9EAA1F
MSYRLSKHWRSRLLNRWQSESCVTPPVIEFVRDDSLPEIVRRSRTFHRSEIIRKYRVKHNLSMCTTPLDVEVDKDNFYRQLLNDVLSHSEPRDIYSVYINSETLSRPIFIHPSRVENRDNEAFLNALYEISQSNPSFLTHGELSIQVDLVKSIRGGGRCPKAPQSSDAKRTKMTRSLVILDSSVGFCFLRALAMCIYHKEQYSSTSRRQWCYNNKFHHKCDKSCRYCFSPEECPTTAIRSHCVGCNIIFPSISCYNNHKDRKMCGQIKRCDLCDTEYTSRYEHKCSANRCEACHLIVKKGHSCYVKPLEFDKLVSEDSQPRVFIFFDIESYQRQQSSQSEDELIHSPMLLVFKIFCHLCISPETAEKNQDPCQFCGKGLYKFWGPSCVSMFCDYLYESIAKKVEDVDGCITVFAHNGRGYDFHFILRDLFKRAFTATQIMMNGNKIMHMKIGNVSFVDSLQFFGQSLSSLPKAFGIQSRAVKGFFPHDFNKPENWLYVGPYPDRKYFKPDMMSSDTFSQFDPWYIEKVTKNEVFNFKEDIIKYCTNDVEILASCCLIFRNKFLDLNGLDPFSRCFTIAQVGLELLRGLYSTPNTLAVAPINGYSNVRKCSRKSLAWLDYQGWELNEEILREYRIGHHYADGYSPSSNTVFEFFGCHFHGCPKCYPNDRYNQLTYLEDSLDTRYKKTLEKLRYYEARKFKVVSIWECELKACSLSDPALRVYVTARTKYWWMVDYFGHADIRESFFGGRTNNIKFYHECSSDEEIKYMDVNSLYPYVLKSKKYPVDHPTVINENFDLTLESYFGFVKCRILPPKNLYIPNDRSLIGTWTTAELSVAIKHGYKVMDIIEVLHYQKSSSEIFSEYIKKLLIIKHEASGWPSWCEDDVSKKAYLDQVIEREGAELNPANISKNPALRFMAKLLLNSLWGKLAQNPDKKKVEIITDYNSYFKKLTDDKIRITSEVMVNDNTILLQWKNIEESLEYGPNTSLSVASFVTSYAHLELLDRMMQVENIRKGSLLYFDTDSLIYYRKLEDPKIECGDHLGQLKDEIVTEYGRGAAIMQFVTCGPKNYAFKVNLPDGSTKTVIKTKGITLNKATLQFINYEFMFEAAKEYGQSNSQQRMIRAPQFSIVSDSHHNILTRYFMKAYKIVSEKRIVCNNFTFPYGFDESRYQYSSEK